jgi:hypothetical protein
MALACHSLLVQSSAAPPTALTPRSRTATRKTASSSSWPPPKLRPARPSRQPREPGGCRVHRERDPQALARIWPSDAIATRSAQPYGPRRRAATNACCPRREPLVGPKCMTPPNAAWPRPSQVWGGLASVEPAPRPLVAPAKHRGLTNGFQRQRLGLPVCGRRTPSADPLTDRVLAHKQRSWFVVNRRAGGPRHPAGSLQLFC